MASQTTTAPITPGQSLPTRRIVLLALAAAFCFSALAYWGGMPPDNQVPLFLLGIVVMVAVGAGISFLAWHFLLRPMPGLIVLKGGLLKPIERYVLGVMLVLAIIMESVGGAWDEAWHTKYGMPFGKDFFWRPHLLIYAGLLIILAASFLGWILLNVRGKGTMIQRFRSDPLVGIMALVALVMVYALPADPIWHGIYGDDLSAFSIPHVVLALLITISLLVGVALIVPALSIHAWRGIQRLQGGDLLLLVGFAALEASLVQVMTSDWFNVSAQDVASGNSRLFQRPDWLPYLFIAIIGTLLGTLVVTALRFYGAATLTGLLGFVLRSVLVTFVGHPNPSASMWLLCLPPMIGIDVIAFILVRRGHKLLWWQLGLAGAIGTTVGSLPLFNRFLIYPQLSLANLIPTLIAVFLGALAAAWVGNGIGSYMANQPVVAETTEVSASPSLIRRWFAPGALVLFAVFVVFFVMTAAPPFTS